MHRGRRESNTYGSALVRKACWASLADRGGGRLGCWQGRYTQDTKLGTHDLSPDVRSSRPAYTYSSICKRQEVGRAGVWGKGRRYDYSVWVVGRDEEKCGVWQRLGSCGAQCSGKLCMRHRSSSAYNGASLSAEPACRLR